MVRCFFEEIKVLLLLACCRNVEKIEDIFQSHFNAVKKHLHFQLDDFLLGLVIQSLPELSYNSGKNSDLWKCSGEVRLLNFASKRSISPIGGETNSEMSCSSLAQDR